KNGDDTASVAPFIFRDKPMLRNFTKTFDLLPLGDSQLRRREFFPGFGVLEQQRLIVLQSEVAIESGIDGFGIGSMGEETSRNGGDFCFAFFFGFCEARGLFGIGWGQTAWSKPAQSSGEENNEGNG